VSPVLGSPPARCQRRGHRCAPFVEFKVRHAFKSCPIHCKYVLNALTLYQMTHSRHVLRQPNGGLSPPPWHHVSTATDAQRTRNSFIQSLGISMEYSFACPLTLFSALCPVDAMNHVETTRNQVRFVAPAATAAVRRRMVSAHLCNPSSAQTYIIGTHAFVCDCPAATSPPHFYAT
jgi:hypothetical protein